MKRILVLCASFLVSSPILAASLQVSPTAVSFGKADKATAMWLSNTGTEPMKGQVSVFAWLQTIQGETLVETRNIVASPPVVDIPPGGKQMVRLVRMDGKAITTEQAYRVIVDEIPQPQEGVPQEGIKFQLRYSVPVFISPDSDTNAANSKALGYSVKPAQDMKQLQLVVNNSGMTHIKLSNLSYVSAEGVKTVLNPGLVGYVLPESQNHWNIKKLNKGGYFEAVINDGRTPEKLFTWQS